MKMAEEVLVEKLSKNKIELFAMLVSVLMFVLSLSLFLYVRQDRKNQDILVLQEEEKQASASTQEKIFVDVSGAVIKPDMYEVTSGARLKDALVLSGGLSDKADRAYFSRQYNLASQLSDGQKIYIPTKLEVMQGVAEISFNSQQEAVAGVQNSASEPASGQINVNTASAEALDTLFGVGPATAQKIIANRPYASIDELLSKKAVNKRVFEMISDKVVAF